MPQKVSNFHYHPILKNNLNEEYASNSRKAKLYKVAATISSIAILALTAYLLISIGIVSTSTIMMSHFLIGMSLPIFSLMRSKLNTLVKDFFLKSKQNFGVINELKSLSAKKISDIRSHLLEIKIKKPLLNSDIKTLLPAIAHYNYWTNFINEKLKEIDDINKIKTTDPSAKKKLQKQIHNIFEKDILKAKLMAAEAHHIITHPKEEKSLFSFGKIFYLSFSDRWANILSGEDTYFIFFDKVQKDRKKQGISFSEVNMLTIENLSELIFK